MIGDNHVVTIERTRVVDPDEAGRGGVEVDRIASVRGRFSILSAAARVTAAQIANNVSASFHAPLGSTVAVKDRIRAERIAPEIDGAWEIAAIQYTPLHLRLLLARVEI